MIILQFDSMLLDMATTYDYKCRSTATELWSGGASEPLTAALEISEDRSQLAGAALPLHFPDLSFLVP
jgi:hypothetical protein